MLVIHPDECIDCGVCEPECPVDAIKPDSEPGLDVWLTLNSELAEIWPVITEQKEPPSDAVVWKDAANKLAQLSRNPAEA
jgi:ferredoxin